MSESSPSPCSIAPAPEQISVNLTANKVNLEPPKPAETNIHVTVMNTPSPQPARATVKTSQTKFSAPSRGGSSAPQLVSAPLAVGVVSADCVIVNLANISVNPEVVVVILVNDATGTPVGQGKPWLISFADMLR